MGRYRPQCKDNQLTLNFEQGALPAVPMSPEHAAIVHGHLPPPGLAPATQPKPEPPKRAVWNFRDTFPAPLEEAVTAGMFNDDDLDSEQVESIHVEMANELLALMDSIAACETMKLTGRNPDTGKLPRTAAGRKRLADQAERKPKELQAEFNNLLSAYADGFGDEAATAFAEWVRDLHRNQLPRPRLRSAEIDLPVPTPLPNAVKNGVFGWDDNDDPINPSEDEVREISLQHGEQLAELYQELGSINERLAGQPANREELIRHQERLTCQAQSMLALYAEDFGETAARHLESWARHLRFE